jgi:hypothetical protein
LDDKIADVGAIRALGFSVSVEHTRCMAEPLVVVGIFAKAPNCCRNTVALSVGRRDSTVPTCEMSRPLVEQVNREDHVDLPVAHRIQRGVPVDGGCLCRHQTGVSIAATNMIAGLGDQPLRRRGVIASINSSGATDMLSGARRPRFVKQQSLRINVRSNGAMETK